MKQELTKNIITEKGENQFQLRILRGEGVGLLTTRSNDNYLILDSLDYWYDLIQKEYPKRRKCTCKNDWFEIQFLYKLRTGTDDFKEVKITATCTNCSKALKAISIDINYSPTEQLVTNPFIYCEKPNIRYKFSELTSYWSGDNLTTFLFFIFNNLKLNVYCWFFKYPENTRFFEKVTYERAIEIITVNHRYLNFYFTRNELDKNEYIISTDEKGVYLKEGIWRKNEIIQLSAPYVIAGYGLLYYINFCNQYLDKGEVKDKSITFQENSKKIMYWLKENFITDRGKNCFDGKEAYKKFVAAQNSIK